MQTHLNGSGRARQGRSEAEIAALLASFLDERTALDRPLTVTQFFTRGADRKREHVIALCDLAPLIRKQTASTKDRLPWIKLATFGEQRSDKNSLRHDGNVLTIEGVEGDYDGGEMPLEVARDRLERACIAALLHTTASHTEAKPRWRVLCPTSGPLPPERREALVARLDGVLGGVLKSESFTLSQAFYYGRVEGHPEPRVELVLGRFIDADAIGENGESANGRDDSRSARAFRLAHAVKRRGLRFEDYEKELRDDPELWAWAEEQRDGRNPRRAWDNCGVPEAAEDSLDELVNPAALEGIEPPAREWIVEGWLPAGTVTSLYGGAGYGKTLLAQQLQTATALGAPFLGLETAGCRSLAFYCEDDNDELHRRALAICRQHGARLSDLGLARWQGRAGKANVMAAVEGGILKPTGFFDFVRDAALATGARLLILDNIAQLFAGNESTRAEVTQYVNALSAIALEIGGAVLLLGHPSKGEGSEYSGSTAWDAAVRSRWLLERPKAEADARELADIRVLRKPKANYAGTGDEIALRWERGAFVAEGQGAVDEAAQREAEGDDERAFLACLDALTRQGRNVSHAPSTNYAPKVMAEMARLSRKRLAAAMERLFAKGQIAVGEFGRGKDRHKLRGIVRYVRDTRDARL